VEVSLGLVRGEAGDVATEHEFEIGGAEDAEGSVGEVQGVVLADAGDADDLDALEHMTPVCAFVYRLRNRRGR